jgi:hypothetical protein
LKDLKTTAATEECKNVIELGDLKIFRKGLSELIGKKRIRP